MKIEEAAHPPSGLRYELHRHGISTQPVYFLEIYDASNTMLVEETFTNKNDARDYWRDYIKESGNE